MTTLVSFIFESNPWGEKSFSLKKISFALFEVLLCCCIELETVLDFEGLCVTIYDQNRHGSHLKTHHIQHPELISSS